MPNVLPIDDIAIRAVTTDRISSHNVPLWYIRTSGFDSRYPILTLLYNDHMFIRKFQLVLIQ